MTDDHSKPTLRRRYRSNPFGLSQVKIIRELLEVFPPMWQSEIHEILEEADLPCTKGAVNTAVDQATRRLAYAVSAEPEDRPVLIYQRDSDGLLRMTRGWPGLLEGK